MSVYGSTPDSATNTLGGEALPSQTLWTDRHQYVGWVQTQRVAINGERDTLVQTLIAGQPITLSISRPLALITDAKRIALQALLSPIAQTLVLAWEGTNYNVIFDQSRSPAIELEEVTDVNGFPVLETGRYEGTIKLITV